MSALFPETPDAATDEEHAHHCERHSTVGPDERQFARQPADDEDETDEDAAHDALPVEGGAMIVARRRAA